MNRPEGELKGANQADRRYRLHCWGDLALVDPDGLNATPKSRKARALVAWLAFHPDRPVSRERLAGLLWGDRGEEQARSSLRQALFELRPLGEGPLPLLDIERSAVTLFSAQLNTDLHAAPEDEDLLFANLDDMDEGFDNWLRTVRAAPTAHLPLHVPMANEPATAEPPTARRGFRFALPILLLVLAIVVGAILLDRLFRREAPALPSGAIAVLPFQAGKDPGDSARAQGLSDDIRRRLGRNEGADVIGRYSSTLPSLSGLSAASAGQAIGADYVLEGSIRTSGGSSLVEARLARASDDATLWSSRISGAPDDLFDVQRTIGAAVEKRLGLGQPNGAIAPPRGDVYALLMTARELAMTLEGAKLEAAEGLLRRAVEIDPQEPRAHAELARAIFWQLDLPPSSAGQRRRHAEAKRHAQIALRLAPDLADSHLAMAAALENRADPAPALAQLEQAAKFDPGRGETWFEIARLNERLGRYPQAMDAYRQAARLEPYWWPVFYYAAETAWTLGLHDESMEIANRVLAGTDPIQALLVEGDVAWRTGDFSREVAAGQKALARTTPGQGYFAQLTISRALRAAGLNARARTQWAFYPVDDLAYSAWLGKAPTPAQFRALAEDPAYFWGKFYLRQLTFRNMVNEGRTREVVALLDRSAPDPVTLRRHHLGAIGFLCQSPALIIALREEGRNEQANALMAAARAEADRIVSAPLVPLLAYQLDAELLMLEGKPDQAIRQLQKAYDRGFLYARLDLLGDIGDEPAFRSLRGNPQFERLRAAEAAHIARERREILAQSSIPASN